MAELKTKPSRASVSRFLSRVPADRQRDCRTLVRMMTRATGARPVMWGPSIVGFGRYDYRYATGRTGSWFLTGFSPRKQDLTVYVMTGFDRVAPLLARLGTHRTGKSCLYLKRLANVDVEAFERLIVASVRHLQRLAK